MSHLVPALPRISTEDDSSTSRSNAGDQSWRLTGKLSSRVANALDEAEKEVERGLKEVDDAINANYRNERFAGAPVIDPALIAAKQLIARPHSTPNPSIPRSGRQRTGTVTKNGYVFTDPHASKRRGYQRRAPLSAQPGQRSQESMHSTSVSSATQ
ncbi:hypothetical protein CYMTET_36409, partial [Cymbomonas tetramitiformis]